MRRMSTCAYTDFITDAGSPMSSADESFSDSETSTSAPDSQNPRQMGLSYLSDFFAGPACSDSSGSTGTDSDGGSGGNLKSKSGRKPCKYVPHREKPVHVVEKRNARERRRVEAVNSAFVRLRRMVPHENRRKRISKVKTLRVAIDYINYLQDMIEDYDSAQIQEMSGLQQVPAGNGGVGVGGMVVPHPAYIQQGPPGWGCRPREEQLQGQQYHHQQQHQHHHQQSQHLPHEYISSSNTHVHQAHQYQHHQQNQQYYQEESLNGSGFNSRRGAVPDYSGQNWSQGHIPVYNS